MQAKTIRADRDALIDAVKLVITECRRDVDSVRLGSKRGILTLACGDEEYAVTTRVKIPSRYTVKPFNVLRGPFERVLKTLRRGDEIELLINRDDRKPEKVSWGEPACSLSCDGFRYTGELVVQMPRKVYERDPEDESRYSVVFTARDLRRRLKLASFAVLANPSGTTSHYTHGVCIAADDWGLDFVGTDGHRLTWLRREWDKPTGVAFNWLVPMMLVKRLLAVMPDDDTAVTVGLRTHSVAFCFGDVRVEGKLYDIKYPDYVKVTPKSAKTRLRLDRKEFMAVLRRARTAAELEVEAQGHGDNLVVNLERDGDWLVVGGKRSRETVACEHIGPHGTAAGKIAGKSNPEEKPGQFSVWCNPVYLCDVVRRLPDGEVVLGWLGAANPIVVTAPELPGFKHIIMPIRRD